ncbi:MAG: amidohydrolase family protein, partial [Armatimonadota bacterium]
MNILDFCVGIGQWPFRRLRHRSADEVLGVMDEHGIAQAVVSSLEAVLYKNCQPGNEDLAEVVAARSDRFVPLACLNPTFPGAVGDLRRCMRDLGMRGVKLYPNYHDYLLADEAVTTFLEAARDLDPVVVLVVRVEDERLHHWRMLVPPTPIPDIAETIRRHPDLRFLVSGANRAE